MPITTTGPTCLAKSLLVIYQSLGDSQMMMAKRLNGDDSPQYDDRIVIDDVSGSLAEVAGPVTRTKVVAGRMSSRRKRRSRSSTAATAGATTVR